MILSRDSLDPPVFLFIEALGGLVVDCFVDLDSVRDVASEGSLMVLYGRRHLVPSPIGCSTPLFDIIIRISNVLLLFFFNRVEIVGLVYGFVGGFVSDKGFLWR